MELSGLYGHHDDRVAIQLLRRLGFTQRLILMILLLDAAMVIIMIIMMAVMSMMAGPRSTASGDASVGGGVSLGLGRLCATTLS